MSNNPGMYNTAVKLTNAADELRKQNNLKDAIDKLEQSMDIHKDFYADSLLEAANAFSGAGCYEDAVGLCTEAKALHPPNSQQRGDVFQIMAEANDCMGKHDLANEQFQEVQRIYGTSGKDHMYAQLLHNWAKSLKKQGRLDEAVAKFNEAGFIWSDMPGHEDDIAVNFHHMGDAWQDKGKWSFAEDAYMEALRRKREVFGKGPSYRKTLNSFVTLLEKMGRHPAADMLRTEEARVLADETARNAEAQRLGQDGQEEIFERISKKPSNKNKHNLAMDLRNAACGLQEESRVEAASFLLQPVVAIRRAFYAESLHRVAVTLHESEEYARAASLWSQALELHPPDSQERSDILQNLAGANDDMGQHATANKQYQEAHRFYENDCEDLKDYRYANLLHNWGVLLKKQQKWDEAWPKLLQAGTMWRSMPGHDEDFAKHLHDMGDFWHDKGRFCEAESYYREALRKKRDVFVEDHPSYAKTLNNLSALLQEMGRCHEAKEQLNEGARIRERCAKDNQLFHAFELQNHGSLLHELGQFGSAVEYFKKALQIRKGHDNLNYAVTLSSLAHAMMDMAQYEEAESKFKEAIAIKDACVERTHSSYIISCANLGHLYCRMGAYNKALGSFLQAMEVSKKTFGREHPCYIDSLAELATFEAVTDQEAEAEEHWKENLKLNKAIRPKHSCCTVAVSAIAQLRQRAGCPQEARDLLEREKKRVERNLNRTHHLFAELLAQLAVLYDVEPSLGQDAEPLHKEAIKTLKEVFGEGHPQHLDALRGFACHAHFRGEHERALEILEKVHDWNMRMFNAMLPVLPEQRRLLFLQHMQKEAQLCPWVALQSQQCAAEVAQQCFRIAAVQKGLIYQVQWAMARACTPTAHCADSIAAPKEGQKEAQERLVQTRAELVKAVFSADGCEGVKTVEALLEEFEHCEVQLGRHLRDTASPFTHTSLLENVANELPSKAALAEYVTYHGPLGADIRYGVFVIPTAANRRLPGGGVQVHLRGLGSAEDLKERVHQLFQMIRELPATQLESKFCGEEEIMELEGEYQKYAGELRREILDPVLAVAGEDLEHLFISPDGELWQVPFEALPLECNECHAASGAEVQGHQKATRFVMDESFTLSYLSSSKDLLPNPHVQKTGGIGGIETDQCCVVFANPDFDLQSSHPGSTALAAPVRNTSSPKKQWNDLKGTRDESFMVRERMESAGHKVQLVEGQKATVEELKRVARPVFLHIATHGYVIFGDGMIGGNKKDSLGKLAPLKMQGLNNCLEPLEHPFFRGGLALAGARAWQRGAPLLCSGHITALECCCLDLMGTRHVTLSACDMARGESWSGQGVMSMGRAFQMAGAESVLLSLWDVEDKKTPHMMNHFYKHLFGGFGRAAALRQAQRFLRSEGEPLRIWASFALYGQPGQL